MTDHDLAPAPEGYRRNARGDLIREANITQRELDEDRTVALVCWWGEALSAQMHRYREHTRDDVYAHLDRVRGEFGGRVGGRKGNVTLTSFDGLRRVVLAQAETVTPGTAIQAARDRIDECLDDWLPRARVELQALVQGAFRAASDGALSVAALLRLRRVEIDDPRWREVQRAIAEALRPTGRAEYIRLYRRASPGAPWEQVPLHLARVRPPPVEPDAEALLEQRLLSAAAEARDAGVPQRRIRELAAAALKRGGPVGRLP